MTHLCLVVSHSSLLKANTVEIRATEQTSGLQNVDCGGLFPYLIANFQPQRGKVLSVDTPLV